jgi:putative ABC transport system ATP-binding protein
MANILEARGLQRTYHMGDVTVQALRGVDFAVEQGEFVAIMGASGSGKSTLLHLLGGLDVASGGDVLLEGRSYQQMNDDALTRLRRREIGFIFQFFNLVPTLSASENIALSVMLDGRKVDEARLQHLLNLVGLSDRANHKPHQLSGGQQQRIAIARALMTQPKILLADEPTGNLDSNAGNGILGLMRQACDDEGQTIVMVTHDRHAATLADRVVFLKDGAIVNELAFANDAKRTQEVAGIMDALA